MVSVALVVKEVPSEETKDEVAAFLSGAVEMLNARAGRLACVNRGQAKAYTASSTPVDQATHRALGGWARGRASPGLAITPVEHR